MQPRLAARLSPTDAAYFAGLIDGEGSISLTRLHRGQNRQLALSISNTERALLEWVLNTTHVGKITTKRMSSPLHAPGLTYSVANRQALALLMQVAPFLKSYKAERAQLVIDHYVRLTPRNGKYTNAMRVERCEFERRFAAISMRRRQPSPGDGVREAVRPWPAGSSPAPAFACQPPCIDFTYSATACS